METDTFKVGHLLAHIMERYTPTPEPSASEILTSVGFSAAAVACGLFFFAVAAGLIV